jgi:hypothetical protein
MQKTLAIVCVVIWCLVVVTFAVPGIMAELFRLYLAIAQLVAPTAILIILALALRAFKRGQG